MLAQKREINQDFVAGELELYMAAKLELLGIYFYKRSFIGAKIEMGNYREYTIQFQKGCKNFRPNFICRFCGIAIYT